MTLAEALERTTLSLKACATEEARLEAELLLAHVLSYSRSQLFARFSERFPEEPRAELGKLLARRLEGEPLAYLLGHREFYGLNLEVDRRVLIPRPETELLVERALKLARSRFPHHTPTIADVGTGSGAIAVALAVHLSQARLFATDISSEALEVAQQNANRHGVRDHIQFIEGALATPLPSPVDLLLANLPYVKTSDLSPLLGHGSGEPRIALDGGMEGLNLIRRLIPQLPKVLNRPGWALLEIGAWQAKAIQELTTQLIGDAQVQIHRDLAGHDRIAEIYLPPFR